MKPELTQEEREEIEGAASEQVKYEKTVVDATVAKSRFVIETLQAAGYCEEHVESMVQPIMLASVLQQISDVLLDMRTIQEGMAEQLEIIDNTLEGLTPE